MQASFRAFHVQSCPCAPSNAGRPALMISCALKGGLGNMLFQVATTVALAAEHGDEATFDFRGHTASQGQKPAQYRETIFRNLGTRWWFRPRQVYKEPHFHYSAIPYAPGLRLQGYFQSERYFADHRAQLLNLFAPTDAQSSYLRTKYSAELGGTTVSLHVRRGDYLRLSDYHLCLDPAFYSRALATLHGYDRVLVFSDDIAWCRDAFGGAEYVFVSEQDDLLELYLMTMCTHHILANSSFSWWGAWLDVAEGRVVAPRAWFGPAFSHHDTKDLIPARWQRIE